MHPIRQMAASDHEGVSIAILEGRNQPRTDHGAGRHTRHGPKEHKPQASLEQAFRDTARCRGDPQQAIQRMANEITQPRRNYRAYRESREVKQLRTQAKQARDGQQSRTLWKQMWRLRAKEKEVWQRDLLTAVLAEDWQALRATKAAKRAEVWEEELTTKEKWKETMQEHVEGIFAKMPAAQVKAGLAEIWAQLQRKCKTTRWRPFSTEEVRLSTVSWASGKSTGPDGISTGSGRRLSWKSSTKDVPRQTQRSPSPSSCLRQDSQRNGGKQDQLRSAAACSNGRPNSSWPGSEKPSCEMPGTSLPDQEGKPQNWFCYCIE